MSQARGYKGRLVLDFETAFKTPPATPAGLIMPVNKADISGDRPKQKPNTLTGRRDPVKPFEGNMDVGGSLEVPLDAYAFGYWLKAIFGQPNTTDNGDGTYTHVFKTGDLQPSLILETQFTDKGIYKKSTGCKIGSLSMSVGTDGELTASMNVLGATEDLSSTPYDNDPTSPNFVRFNAPHASIKEGGSTIAIVTDLSLDIDFGLDGDVYTVGTGGTRGDIPEGLMNISGNMTSLFESLGLLNKAVNSTESSLEITFDNGEEKLIISIPELQYARKTPGLSGPQGVRLETPFQAYYDDNADGSSLVFTLINTQESY